MQVEEWEEPKCCTDMNNPLTIPYHFIEFGQVLFMDVNKKSQKVINHVN